jgi:hypothetical protein
VVARSIHQREIMEKVPEYARSASRLPILRQTMAAGGREKEATMTSHDSQVNRVTQRAYEFAMSGAFESMAALERQLVLEGFGHNLWWLERPGVRRALAEISVSSRRLQASAERASI